jgi:hypothetical protein
MVDCPHDLVFPDPNISVHDGVEEENLTEHDEDDDASQAEDSQHHNRAVKSITTDKEDKDIEAKGNKEDSQPFYDLADCKTYTPNHLCTDT